MSKLALLGGEPVFTEKPPQELFKWPIITQDDKVLENYKDLLEGDKNRLEGDWYGSDYDKDYTKKKA